jgi:hypothetical protein
MSYLLDANVFIQAKNLHYGLISARRSGMADRQQSADGRVCSIDKVSDELAAGDR